MIESLLELTKTDFKLRYKSTLFGYLWSVLNPILMLVTLYIVFSHVMRLEIMHYQVFLLIGIISWNFFAEATTLSMNSLIAKADLIKKTNFPVELIVFSSCLLSLITMVISLIILLIMMIVFGITFRWIMLLSAMYLFFLFILVLGISYFLSAFYLFFRDLAHIWNFLLLVGFWLTPIIYSELQIPAIYRKIYMLNPIARIINHLRDSLLNNYFSFEQTMITTIICFSALFIGVYLFNKHSSRFAEEL